MFGFHICFMSEQFDSSGVTVSCRKRLFSLINDLPTVFEVVTERKPVKDRPSVDSGSKSRGSTKVIWRYFIFPSEVLELICFSFASSLVDLNIFKSVSSIKIIGQIYSDEQPRLVIAEMFFVLLLLISVLV